MKRATGLFLFAAGLLFGVLGLSVGLATLPEVIGSGWVCPAVAVGGGLAGVGLAVVGGLLMRGSRPLGSQPPVVEGRVGSYLAGTTERREIDGRPYERLYRRPIRRSGQEAFLAVRVPAATPVQLRFDRETWFDKACKAVRISREHQTGDAEFDAAVYVRGPDGGFAGRYLTDPAKRLAIRELLAAGFARVRLTGRVVVAEWPGFDPPTHHRRGLTDEAAVHLHALAADLPPAEPRERPARGDDPSMAGTLLWLFLIAWAATVAALFLYPPVRVGDWLLPAAGVFVVGYPLFLWVAAFVHRGQADSHDRWVRVAGVGLFLFAAGSVGAVAAANGLADGSPPLERTLPVVDKDTSPGRRGGTRYFVVVAAWDGSNGTSRVDVSVPDYNRVVPRKSQVRVTTGRGLLGIEWLRRKQVEP